MLTRKEFHDVLGYSNNFARYETAVLQNYRFIVKPTTSVNYSWGLYTEYETVAERLVGPNKRPERLFETHHAFLGFFISEQEAINAQTILELSR